MSKDRRLGRGLAALLGTPGEGHLGELSSTKPSAEEPQSNELPAKEPQSNAPQPEGAQPEAVGPRLQQPSVSSDENGSLSADHDHPAASKSPGEAGEH